MIQILVIRTAVRPHLVDDELCCQESVTEGAMVILQHFLASCHLLSQLTALVLIVLLLQENSIWKKKNVFLKIIKEESISVYENLE